MSRAPRFQLQPRREWYPVALSGDVSRSPMAVEPLGTKMVLYRTLAGDVVAQEDRCPHRNVPLSGGRCLPDDTLECPYHGWRFRPDGQCSLIPASTLAPRPTHRVPVYPVHESQGLVFVCPDSSPPPHLPFRVPEADDGEHSVLVRKVEFPAGLHQVVENALDVPHTSILHGGLFRTGERNRVQVKLRRFKEWAEASYEGEPPPKGLAARLLSFGQSGELTVGHWDRFFLPSVLQVEYRLGTKVHFLITGVCTPIEADRTELYAIACVRTPLPSFLERVLLRLIEPIAMRVLRQDVDVLRAQTQNVDDFGGEKFMSTEIDVLGASVTRLLKDACGREAEVESGAQAAAESGERFSVAEEPVQVADIELDA